MAQRGDTQGSREVHFTIADGGVAEADYIRLELGDQLLFEVTDVAPMEDGAVGITIRFEEVL